jgi:fatty acid desaturase
MRNQNLLDFKLNDVKHTSGSSYVEFRKGLKPKFLYIWLQIFLAYIFLFSILTANHFFQLAELGLFSSAILVFISAFLIGYAIAFITLFLHEASHNGLASKPKLNDLLGTICCGFLVGTTTSKYRLTHWQHHLHLGTKKDPENSYFQNLSLKNILSTLFFITAFQKIVSENKPEQVGKKKFVSNLSLFFGLLFHLTLLSIFFFNNEWLNFFSWIIGVFTFFPFFGWLRQLLEHRSLEAKSTENYFEVDQNAASRIFYGGFLTKTFGAAGFDKHLLHHWDHSISCTRLSDVENFLKDSNVKDYVFKESTTYFSTFKSLMRQK